MDLQRLRTLLRGLEDDLPGEDARMTSDKLISVWQQKAEIKLGQLGRADLQTIRDAVRLYRRALHLSPEQDVSIGDFSAFLSEEVEASPCAATSSAGGLRAAVARDLGSLHKFLREFRGEGLNSEGGVTCEELRECFTALFALYCDNSLVAEDVVEELVCGGALLTDGRLDMWEALCWLLDRRRAPVELVLYDISQGALRLFSPLLFGRQFEAVYHSSVLVHGTEYWYGGHVFENEPPIDRSVFGLPLGRSVEQLGASAYKPELRVVRLGHTLASPRELRAFLHTEMKPRYRPGSYDVLAHNCNNFSDEVVHFLTGASIPESVRRLPELLMDTPTGKMLRPFLNRWLRGFGSSSEQGPEPCEPEEIVADNSKVESRIWDESVTEGGDIDMGFFDPTASETHRRKDIRRQCIRKESSGEIRQVKSCGTIQVPPAPAAKSEELRQQRKQVRRAAVKRLGNGQLVNAKAL